jgi:hypothetical protein
MKARHSAALIASLALVTPGVAQADVTYTIQPIVSAGATVAGVRLGSTLAPDALNDDGRVIFKSGSASNGALFEYFDGTFTPLIVAGGVAPGGKWSSPLQSAHRAYLNQRGDFVFVAKATLQGATNWGVFRWNVRTRQFTPVALVGMPAVDNLTFGSSSRTPSNAVINDQEEIAFSAYVRDAAGQARRAAFFQGREVKLIPIALPGQALPGGRVMEDFGGFGPMRDDGAVVFRARRSGDPEKAYSGYLWERGTFRPVALVGADAPGGGTITHVSGLLPNKKNQTLLVIAHTSEDPEAAGLYRFGEGKLTPIAVPGQAMPGGGTLDRLLENAGVSSGEIGPNSFFDVSRGNAEGQHVFQAQVEGRDGVYRVDADGKLSQIIAEGATTDRGEITAIPAGFGVDLNNRGQVLLVAQLDGGEPTLVVLTPTAP